MPRADGSPAVNQTPERPFSFHSSVMSLITFRWEYMLCATQRNRPKFEKWHYNTQLVKSMCTSWHSPLAPLPHACGILKLHTLRRIKVEVSLSGHRPGTAVAT